MISTHLITLFFNLVKKVTQGLCNSHDGLNYNCILDYQRLFGAIVKDNPSYNVALNYQKLYTVNLYDTGPECFAMDTGPHVTVNDYPA